MKESKIWKVDEMDERKWWMTSLKWECKIAKAAEVVELKGESEEEENEEEGSDAD